jgi:hypothetical protein
VACTVFDQTDRRHESSEKCLKERARKWAPTIQPVPALSSPSFFFYRHPLSIFITRFWNQYTYHKLYMIAPWIRISVIPFFSCFWHFFRGRTSFNAIVAIIYTFPAPFQATPFSKLQPPFYATILFQCRTFRGYTLLQCWIFKANPFLFQVTTFHIIFGFVGGKVLIQAWWRGWRGNNCAIIVRYMDISTHVTKAARPDKNGIFGWFLPSSSLARMWVRSGEFFLSKFCWRRYQGRLSPY